MGDLIRVQLLPHAEKLAPANPFPVEATGPTLLYHQWRTYEALRTHALVVNTYNTGTGKTRAALLHLLDPTVRGVNMLFIAPTNELIAQHARDITEFMQRAGLDYHVIHVDAQTLRGLPTPHDHERVGERLNRLFQNPREYGWDGRKPLAVVTNPDIFYYALYFSAYHPHDRRNLFEQFMLRFDYVVIDEFHYYGAKQLASFLFYFVICREWGYFEKGRKVCLLSATPEPEVTDYLQRVFQPGEVAFIAPATEPPDSATWPTVPALAPTTLEIQVAMLDEFAAALRTQTQLREWVMTNGWDGALISGALWRINVAHAALKPAFGEQMARITGAEKVAQRRAAPKFPLILATPTVDIGYNFDKPGKTRQPLDFVAFDARTRDQFLQRLGRAGRVLNRPQTDAPARAIGLLNTGDEEGWAALKALDGQTIDRRTLTEVINAALPARRDLYSYLQSYAMTEALRPMFQIGRTLRPDLREWLEKLFDGVRAVFAPENPRWRFGSIEGVMRRFEKLERIVRRKEDGLLADFLQEYLDWQKLSVSSEQYAHLAKGLASGGRVREQMLAWVEAEYWLAESLFSFREALQTPNACVFDSKHLLADADVSVYDALHIATNYDAEWFADESDFAAKTGQKGEPAPIYGRLRDHRSPRLRLIFEYAAPDRMDRERFEAVYCRRPVALKGLRLRAELADGSGPFPLDQRVRRAFEETGVPLLSVREGTVDSGVLRGRLRDTNIFLRLLKVSFADGSEGDYLAVVGSAAFVVHAEMEKFFWVRERKEDSQPLFA